MKRFKLVQTDHDLWSIEDTTTGFYYANQDLQTQWEHEAAVAEMEAIEAHVQPDDVPSDATGATSVKDTLIFLVARADYLGDDKYKSSDINDKVRHAFEVCVDAGLIKYDERMLMQNYWRLTKLGEKVIAR